MRRVTADDRVQRVPAGGRDAVQLVYEARP